MAKKAKAAGMPASNKVIQFPTKPKKVFEEELVSFTVANPVFGFMPGDKVVCKTEFEFSELRPDSLVISEFAGKRNVVVFGLTDPKTVIAVAVSVRREVEL